MAAWWDRQRRQGCWAHRKRDWQQLVDWGPGARPSGQGLLAIAAAVVACWQRYRRGASDRAPFRQERAPHQAARRQARDAGAVGAAAQAAGGCPELLQRWLALGTCVTVDGVEPTQNRAAPARRPAVVGRHGSVGVGTHRPTGRRVGARLLPVAATCHPQHRPLRDVLRRALVAARTGAPPPARLPTPAQ